MLPIPEQVNSTKSLNQSSRKEKEAAQLLELTNIYKKIVEAQMNLGETEITFLEKCFYEKFSTSEILGNNKILITFNDVMENLIEELNLDPNWKATTRPYTSVDSDDVIVVLKPKNKNIKPSIISSILKFFRLKK